ncbi:MAG: ATP synthase F1 subunit gamma [Thermoguttaceae bacterium]|nr:ATP synthase F1 subunit gamma [Thermoguttaceae bacterium]
MAKARTLDKRRKSVRNIRKITRTMELISTAQFRRAMDRALSAAAYTQRITSLVGHLAAAGHSVSHPLLEPRSQVKRAALLVLTANRGMCGGYNSGVMRQAFTQYHALSELVGAANVSLSVAGKRGISTFRFRKIGPARSFMQFDDKPAFDEVDEIAMGYLNAYLAGEIDRLDVCYTKFEGMSKQYPVTETLLPLGSLESATPKKDAAKSSEKSEAMSGKKHTEAQYEFLPSAAGILDEIVPMSFRVRMFKCFLDAAVSEQVARMVAMKAATENADQMISNLSVTYNRARQSAITNELLEIIGGADAISKS